MNLLGLHKSTEKASFSVDLCISIWRILAQKQSLCKVFQSEKVLKSHVFDERKTALQYLLDAIMLLTFFDAVVIAIATCSYRDSNMMLST